jgi:predicted MPP superfamily phosphohydrolase
MQRGLSRRQFLRRSLTLAAGVALAGAGGLDYARNVEPGWVDIERVKLKLPRLSPGFDGYRIAQISDIHMGGWMTHERFAEVAAAINDLNLDLVAITGDFVTSRADLWTEELGSVLSTLKAADGVVAVMGNHDQSGNRPIVQAIMRQSGIIELSNNVWTVKRGGERLHIAGVDDAWHKLDRLDDVLRKLPGEGGAILLAHEPDFADQSAATGRFDLQISGHSHGGQVVVPVLGPQRLPPFGRKYPLGLYKVGDMLQYTNRGIGMVRPYVRFNCRPEVTVFTLESA